MIDTRRPDERSADEEIERAQGRDRNLKRGVGTALGAGVGLGTAALSSKLMPLLNEFIPTDLAFKAINKISPNVGKFLKKGMEQGLDLKDGFNFIKENLMGQEQPKPDEERSIIQQYSPELDEFIKGEIQKGRSPIEAGAMARIAKKFDKQINQMEKDHKTAFSSILNATYGQTQQDQPAQQQPMQEQSQPQGQGQQALMAILQQIRQMRGGQ